MMNRDPNYPENKIAHLLLVDDEANIRLPLSRALRLLGYGVEEAGSGPEALALLEHQACDLMVLDVHLPGLNGIEVMHRVRQRYPQLAIIILTGVTTHEYVHASTELGILDFLEKPVSIHQIVAAVSRALQRSPAGK